MLQGREKQNDNVQTGSIKIWVCPNAGLIVRQTVLISSTTMLIYGMTFGGAGRAVPSFDRNRNYEWADSVSYPYIQVGAGTFPRKGLGNSGVQETKDIDWQNVYSELRKEISILKNRLMNSLPIHTMIYMVLSSAAAAISGTLLFVRYVFNIYLIDPYYLICALIIACGLFLTAAVSLKGWKDVLTNGKRD